MKHTISDSNPLTTTSDDCVIALEHGSDAQAVIAELVELYPLAKKALRGWTPSKKGSRTLHVADSDSDTGVRAIHLYSLQQGRETLEEYRALGAYVCSVATACSREAVQVALYSREHDPLEALEHALFAAQASEYSFTAYKKAKKKSSTSVVWFANTKKRSRSLRTLPVSVSRKIEAISWTKDLVNTPAGDLAPRQFVSELRKKFRGSDFQLKVLDKKALTKLKAGALLGVAQGSSAAPYLASIHFKPKTKTSKRIVLIGKGVTFDSGGLSMKTPTGMIDMKCDMAGAAAVAGTMYALSRLPKREQPKVEIIALLPLVENMVSGQSIRPGDVLRTLSGKTIEVLNTDAEGRLILADALEYSARFKPTTIIDVATLTGACCVALGERFAGLFSEHDALANALHTAGSRSGDFLWRLPLAGEEYKSQLTSTIADIKNAGTRYPGASVAALFLQEFAPKDVPWAHLDIAAPAYRSSDYLYRKKGASGFGVALLLEYLAKL